MTSFTRRTHVVRISDASGGTYVDVEVLDAISFRTTNGQEVILDMTASNSNPLIVDDTGGGHGRDAGADATQRSHMKRITNGDQKLDIEVIDVMAFRGINNQEFILDMKATTGEGPAIFDTTDGSGDITATRRVHDEKITDPFGSRTATGFVTSQRCDAISFRTINGQEVIFACPSNDDPFGPDPRAETFIWSPVGYDPANENGPVPPRNTDPHTYVAFVGTAGIETGAQKIAMGPFWWIRKIASSLGYILITIDVTSEVAGTLPPPPADIILTLGPGAKLIDQTTDMTTATTGSGGGTQRIFFIWYGGAPFPTLDNYNSVVQEAVFPNVTYAGQFAQLVNVNETGFRSPTEVDSVDPPPGSGIFATFSEAAAYAEAWNNFYARSAPPINIQWFLTLTTTGGPGLWSPATVGFLDIPLPDNALSETTVENKYLIQVPSASTATTVAVEDHSGGIVTSVIQVKPISDQGTLRHVSDAVAATADNPGARSTRSAPYTVTSVIEAGTPPKAHNVAVVIASGGGGGPR